MTDRKMTQSQKLLHIFFRPLRHVPKHKKKFFHQVNHIATGANLGISPVWGGPNKKTPLERPPGVWAKKFCSD